MTLTELIPALKGNGGRRAVDKVTELRAENRKLLTRQLAADDFFALLTQDRRDVYEAWQFAEHGRQAAEAIVIDQERQIRDLKRQITELERRLQVGVLAEAAATKTQEIDVSAVRTLWDARDAGLLGPVTDPGQVS